jgi:hypothetical protein
MNDSYFKEYLKLLPGLDDFPVFYSDLEKEYLEGSPFLEAIDTEIEDTLYDYNLISKEIPEFGELYTLKEFTEAKMLASSRNFGAKINGESTNILAPLADMINCRDEYNARWFYDNEKEGFVI